MLSHASVHSVAGSAHGAQLASVIHRRPCVHAAWVGDGATGAGAAAAMFSSTANILRSGPPITREACLRMIKRNEEDFVRLRGRPLSAP